jgi:subtilase family protein
VSVLASPGELPRARAALAAAGVRVQRAAGPRLQVAAPPSRIGALGRLAGVAAAGAATPAFQDAVVGEGVERTGAPGLRPLAAGGRGMVVAILDQGFGRDWPARQLEGELPPPQRLELRSFDPIDGLAGTDAYGEPTDHGDLVAQTVHDLAPDARYIFANYHTDQDFVVAVDWLTTRRPDIVVHANNFLEGPFDGTGAAARAADRAAAAGILWFNSAGNYGERHWSGGWTDADGDGVLDWPVNPDWTFSPPAPRRNFGQRLSFALSWTAGPGEAAADLDLQMQRQDPGGGWTTVAASRDRQALGAPPAERITGFPTDTGVYRLRVVLVSGAPPTGALTLFSREVPLAPIGGGPAGSVPTPADARGSISVGAVDWVNLAIQGFSSRGPTADGRLKPDLAAPTNTLVVRPWGPREAGGTSISAPVAAGAAAILWAAERTIDPGVAGQQVLSDLRASALDRGEPGPDPAYGAGVVRLTPRAAPAAAPFPQPAAAGWSAPAALSPPAPVADQPALAVRAGGEAVAAWRQLDGDASAVRAAVLPAEGAWSAAETVSGDDALVRDPAVAVAPTGDAVAVWTAIRAGRSVIRAAVRRSDGGWSPPTDLSPPARAALSPRVAIDDTGNAAAVWVELEAGNEAVRWATHTPAGAWSAPGDLSPTGRGNTEGVLEPRIALSALGDAVAVWTRMDEAGPEVQAAVRPARGGWTVPSALSQSGQAALTPDAAVTDGGGAVAVWTRLDGQQRRFEVQAAERPGGGEWSLPQPLSAPAPAPFQGGVRPRVALDGAARAVAVWTHDGGALRAVRAAARAPGGGWSAPVQLSAPGGDAGAPELALDRAGPATAVWIREGPAGPVVQTALGGADGAWSAPADLSGPRAAAAVAAAGGGVAAAAWLRSSAGAAVVEASVRRGPS